MNVWFCTACGTPSGSLAERCLHCGTPRPGAQGPDGQGPDGQGPGPVPPPVTVPPAAGPPVTGPVPLAQYDVYAPPAQPDGFPAQPAGFPAQPDMYGAQHQVFPPPAQQPAYDPPPGPPEGQPGPPPAYESAFGGYQQPPAYDPNNPNHQPAPAFVPAEGYGPAPAPPPPRQRHRWWVPVLVIMVLLLAGGAIATVLLVDTGGKTTADPQPQPTPTGVSSPVRTPSSPVASASPSASPQLVTTDPTVSDARAADVAALFDDYFTAINNRDYDRALAAYDPAGVINPNDARQAADFKQAIGTTTDSQIVLRSVGPPASGRGVLDARLTFRSNQQPGYGPRERPNEPCTAWDVTYALSQPADEYKILIGRATHAPC